MAMATVTGNAVFDALNAASAALSGQPAPPSGTTPTNTPILSGGTLTVEDLVNADGHVDNFSSAEIQELVVMANQGSLGLYGNAVWEGLGGGSYAEALATVDAGVSAANATVTLVAIPPAAGNMLAAFASSVGDQQSAQDLGSYGAGDVPPAIPAIVGNAAAVQAASTGPGIGTVLFVAAAVGAYWFFGR